jgi:hypothetical protein
MKNKGGRKRVEQVMVWREGEGLAALRGIIYTIFASRIGKRIITKA